MSIKSIIFSILSIVLFVGAIIGIVFLFKMQFIFGLLGILLIAIPVVLNRKAVSEANGGFDKLLAKYIVPILALASIVFIILLFTLWM